MISPKEIFENELYKPETEIDLAYAALLVSQYLHITMNPAESLSHIDAMRQAIAVEMPDTRTFAQRFKALNRYFFAIEKFSGNDEDFTHPHNHFLDKILETKTGSPIGLGILYLSLGETFGLQAGGIDLPDYFLVSVEIEGEVCFVDVFNHGQILTESDCMDIAQVPDDDREPFRQEHLRPISKSDILYRLLITLKKTYVENKMWNLAQLATEMLQVLHPDDASLLRDRGLLAYRMGDLRTAIFDVEAYLQQEPDAVDANWLRDYVEKIRLKLANLN